MGFIEQDVAADVFAPYSNINARGFRELQEGQQAPEAEKTTPA